MSIIAHGIDLVACERVGDVWRRHGDRFLQRILTPREIGYVRRHRHPEVHVAGRFAAKEAVLKVLGTGWRTKISWKDIEILNDRLGKPDVRLSGHCAEIAAALGIARVLISISHTWDYAMASALAVDTQS
jgi:holo-[acyl-carrier protein] synthase